MGLSRRIYCGHKKNRRWKKKRFHNQQKLKLPPRWLCLENDSLANAHLAPFNCLIKTIVKVYKPTIDHLISTAIEEVKSLDTTSNSHGHAAHQKIHQLA